MPIRKCGHIGHTRTCRGFWPRDIASGQTRIGNRTSGSIFPMGKLKLGLSSPVAVSMGGPSHYGRRWARTPRGYTSQTYDIPGIQKEPRSRLLLIAQAFISSNCAGIKATQSTEDLYARPFQGNTNCLAATTCRVVESETGSLRQARFFLAAPR